MLPTARDLGDVVDAVRPHERFYTLWRRLRLQVAVAQLAVSVVTTPRVDAVGREEKRVCRRRQSRGWARRTPGTGEGIGAPAASSLSLPPHVKQVIINQPLRAGRRPRR